jgi:Xaa-Pro aminopeptidase
MVKFDVQVAVSHYYSDVGRTFVYGRQTDDQRWIYDGLRQAHEKMREKLLPGMPICEVYQAGRDALARAGLGRHERGHFGHSVGLDPRIEEPPFISRTETTPLEPGMVMALETPFYGLGVGVFQLEDMCLITEDGCEIWNRLPDELMQIG